MPIYGWALAKEMIDEIVNNKVLVAEFYEDGEFYQSEIIEFEELDTYLSLGGDVKIIGWNKSYVVR